MHRVLGRGQGRRPLSMAVPTHKKFVCYTLSTYQTQGFIEINFLT